MAYIVTNQTVSGEGLVTFSFSPVESLIVAIDNVGTQTSVYGTVPPLRTVRLGWFSFGAEFDPGDGTTREFWTNVLWLDFETTILFAPGRDNTAAGVGQYFDRLRWNLEPPAAGHIWVNTF